MLLPVPPILIADWAVLKAAKPAERAPFVGNAVQNDTMSLAVHVLST